jgi:hypothetical protein
LRETCSDGAGEASSCVHAIAVVMGADLVREAVPFIWFGMVAAVSLLEAPLKFRAPGVTLELGLGIGRLVFRALNCVEACWAVLLAAAAWLLPAAAPTGTVEARLIVGLWVLPAVVLEIVKLVALVTVGALFGVAPR